MLVRLKLRERGLRAGDEEALRVAALEHGHGVRLLAAHAEAFPARDDDVEPGARLEQRRHLGRRLDHVLEVVEQEQEAAVADELVERGTAPECARRSREDVSGVAHLGERNPPDTVRILVCRGRDGLECQASLAAAARARERQQPHIVASE